MSLPNTMSARRGPADALASRVQQLDPLAAELRQGACFNITRLTLVKRRCAEPAAAARFALYGAGLISQSAPAVAAIAACWRQALPAPSSG